MTYYTTGLSVTLLAATLLALSGLWCVDAQFSKGSICPNGTEYAWMANNLGQDPCAIAQFVANASSSESDATIQMHAISPNGTYILLANETNSDTCSSVFYSLTSACALCQNGSYDEWTVWTIECPQVDINAGSLPGGVPDGTAIPDWAYLDVTFNDLFDPSQASGDDSSEHIPTASSSISGIDRSASAIGIIVSAILLTAALL